MRVLCHVAYALVGAWLFACGGSTPEADEPSGSAGGPTLSALPHFGPPAAAERPAPPSGLPDHADDLKFLRDLAETKSFRLGDPSRPQLSPDGSQVFFLRAAARKNELRLYALDVASGKTRELITPDQVL